ncbi:hypothetical protein VNO78_18465 [Psophocarpus tetragonolobus]|uniref:Uncharacterized protein n=1 Tax=Psophocarpus tetragonolobus TaxID=3891 RepID=A0AAN9SJI1_PSOTE
MEGSTIRTLSDSFIVHAVSILKSCKNYVAAGIRAQRRGSAFWKQKQNMFSTYELNCKSTESLWQEIEVECMM